MENYRAGSRTFYRAVTTASCGNMCDLAATTGWCRFTACAEPVAAITEFVSVGGARRRAVSRRRRTAVRDTIGVWGDGSLAVYLYAMRPYPPLSAESQVVVVVGRDEAQAGALFLCAARLPGRRAAGRFPRRPRF